MLATRPLPMMTALLAFTLLTSGCKIVKKEEAPAAQTSQTIAPAAPAVETVTPAFDLDALALSTAPLGEFPYFTLPAGYRMVQRDSGTVDYARFPFWTKGQERWVEGKMFRTGFAAETGKSFSIFEVVKNFDTAIQQLGGSRVTTDEKIPSDIRRAWPKDVESSFYFPFLHSINNPVNVWVIRRSDGNIWVSLAGGDDAGAYVVARESALTPTSQLIGAAELKKAIDTAGKVALQVNFATDKTDILPDSLPQIDQVVELLKADPALKLAINGHTDNSGTKSHNQALSDGRAKAVVAALVAKGIATNRLTARGFGDTQPVADNGSEEGKAKNRRVELVKA